MNTVAPVLDARKLKGRPPSDAASEGAPGACGELVKSVVVVAAEALVCQGMAAAISTHFRVIASAGTVGEALRVVREEQPRFCLVALAPPFPDADVEEACALLAATHARTRTVAVFREPTAKALRAACLNGVSGFLDTSVTPAALRRALEEVDGGDVAVQPSLLRPLVETGRSSDDSATVLSSNHTRALQLLAEGYSSKEIARMTGTTTAAVNHLIERATHRLNASHRAHAVALAFRLGLFA